jgi:hypothetical protein
VSSSIREILPAGQILQQIWNDFLKAKAALSHLF